jgi:NADH pyrophosphatase NudC (nudix superfamily)
MQDMSWPHENEVNPTPEQRAERVLNTMFGISEIHKPGYSCNNFISAEIKDAIHHDEKPRYAVGVSVLLISGGQLLLGRRKNNKAAGMLSTPGGRLEPNESIMECAHREFHEETGATRRRK